MTFVAVVVAVAAVVLTSLCCTRPMRRGRCATTVGHSQREVARLRAEVAALRAAAASLQERR